MSAMHGSRFEASMTGPELVEFFKDLVHSLEGDLDEGEEGIGLSLDEFRKMKIHVKKQDDGFTLKLKIKRPEIEEESSGVQEPIEAGNGEGLSEVGEGEKAQETAPAAGGKKIKYKHLKKRMDKTWDAILKSAENNQVPPKAATMSFLEDSALMVTYSEHDKGPEYYDDYIMAYKEFQQAYEQADMPRILETVQVLERLKKDCHAEYK